ncbi:hypothetical protein [Sphingobacterium sp. UBA6308]|uniref:hypothetical protein n=1 Tax=Sphingobacterium TaxID=28453 RepID=UPI00257B682F|nr:hypothetical protein [Sphingobacterium sp. UBA6308]
MKTTFLKTHQTLQDSQLFNFIDRDRGQIDRYEQRPAVKFPCALIKVNQPKRENLNSVMQRITETVQIRIAFEKNIDQHNLQTAERLEQALQYYDTIETIRTLFQGLKLGNTDRWICTSIIDENRPDFDIVQITFTTSKIEE